MAATETKEKNKGVGDGVRSISRIKSSSRHEVTIPIPVFRCSDFGGVTDWKSLALKDKKESSDEECSTSGSEEKEYAHGGIETFKKLFNKRRVDCKNNSNAKEFQKS
ncbi:hypothetical protein Tco_1214637 [Tanacetum coccineum]